MSAFPFKPKLCEDRDHVQFACMPGPRAHSACSLLTRLWVDVECIGISAAPHLSVAIAWILESGRSSSPNSANIHIILSCCLASLSLHFFLYKMEMIILVPLTNCSREQIRWYQKVLSTEYDTSFCLSNLERELFKARYQALASFCILSCAWHI